MATEFSTKEQLGGGASYVVFELHTEWIRKTQIRINAKNEWIVVASETRRAPRVVLPHWYSETLAGLATRGGVQDASVLFIFDRTFAHLAQQSVAIPRADWNAEITAPELETMIRHGIWKSAQQERIVAGRFLGVHELQVRLADVDVVHMRVDAHRVVSPLGFRGHTLECLFRKLFVKADVWRWITDIIPAEHIVAVTEDSGAWASWVSGTVRQEALFLQVNEKDTIVYTLGGGAVTYRDTVAWGSDVFFAGVAGALGLPAAWTEVLIEKYRNSLCSFKMGRAIENALAEEFSTLLHAIDASRANRSVPVFVHSSVPLPELKTMEHLLQRLGESAHYRQVTPSSLFHDEAPVVHYTRGTTPGPLTPSHETLCALIKWVQHSGHQETLIGKTAKQRVRWTAEQG